MREVEVFIRDVCKGDVILFYRCRYTVTDIINTKTNNNIAGLKFYMQDKKGLKKVYYTESSKYKVTKLIS